MNFTIILILVIVLNFSVCYSQDSAQILQNDSTILGTWQMIDFDSAGYTPNEIQLLDYVHLTFLPNGSLRKTILRVFDQPIIFEGRDSIIGDTVWLKWYKPIEYDGGFGKFEIRSDTLFMIRLDKHWPLVRFKRYVGKEE